jgi:uncharacterized protein (DUF983 family)
MSHVAQTPSTWKKLAALICQRCPRCCKGRIFGGLLRMNDPCPVCGLIFQREEGYFLGAMYVSYALGTFFVGAGYFVGVWLLPDWSAYQVTGAVVACYLVMTPMVFRYSRVIWIFFDRWACPTDVSAGAFEKQRAVEFAHQNRDVDQRND